MYFVSSFSKMEELIGKELGQYQIEAKIGQGAMATVFKAYQSSLDRYVAIKVIPPSFAAENSVFAQRFQREAKSIARLHHPNILSVYDFGIDRDYSYIVMRYVAGAQTLSQVVYRPYGGSPNFELIIQVANALTYAHNHGVVHRDVKPSNVLLDDGWALLTDFGVAKVREFATRLTEVGKNVGTPAYMSPEQARGESVDHRTDIYALGLILYEMLTDTLPHDATTPLAILLKRTTEPPRPPRSINPAIPERVEQVIVQSLMTNPEDRFSTMEYFALALKAAVEEQPYQPPSIHGLQGKPNDILSTTPISINAVDSQPDVGGTTSPPRFRYFIWVVGAVISTIILILVLRGKNAFSSVASQQSPEQTAPVVALVPTSTDTPTFTPTLTATHTPVPPTNTPSPSPSPTLTHTFEPATPIVLVVTATSTPTPTVRPSPTPGLPPATPTVSPTATPSLPIGTFTLLNPLSLDEPSYGLTNFEWEWNDAVPPDRGFEVRVWREGEPLAGAHDAVLDNQQGRIEQIGENRYRLTIDITRAAGVRERTGEYLWTVALVQISPEYADLGLLAEPRHLRFEASGGSAGDSSNNDGSSGGGID